MERTRREVLKDVGRGMFVASLGSAVATDLGLSSAWAVYRSELECMESCVRLTADRPPVVEACSAQQWQDKAQWDSMQALLAKFRLDFNFDFVAIVTPDGKVLIDKRHPDKDKGGLWECSCGSVVSGEDSAAGAVRELEEEVGVKVNPQDITMVGSIRFDPDHVFIDSYIVVKNVDIDSLILQESEVTEARLVTLEELDGICSDNKFAIKKERYKTYRDILASYAKL
jgi:8-oxo-dGTP pyrophosphatase MutT (NUDIX family)